MTELNENCDIVIDQIRAIDNKRLIKKIGNLPFDLITKVKENIDNIGLGIKIYNSIFNNSQQGF